MVFFKGRSPDGQKHVNMLNIPSQKGNANQNHTDSTSLLLEWLSSRTQITTNVGEDVGKKEPSYAVGGNVN
jgi:hypothetical protein